MPEDQHGAASPAPRTATAPTQKTSAVLRLRHAMGATATATSIAFLALFVSIIHLYIDKIRVNSRLTLSVSRLDVNISNLRASDEGGTFDFSVRFQAQATNLGNASAALARIFWVIPNQDQCPDSDAFDWEVTSSDDISKPTPAGFRAIALSMEPRVVPSQSIVAIDAELNQKNFARPTKLLGTGKTTCLAFQSLDAEGERRVRVVPAYEAGIGDTLWHRWHDAIKVPIEIH